MRAPGILAGLTALSVTGALFPATDAAAFWPGKETAPETTVQIADNDGQLDPKAQVLTTTLWEAVSTPAAPSKIDRLLEVRPGDNLMTMLTRAGVNRQVAHTAIASLKGLYDPRRDLRVGDEIQLTFDLIGSASAAEIEQGSATQVPDDEDAGTQFAKLQLPVSFNKDVLVAREDDGSFAAAEIERELERRWVRAAGSIDSSLFQNGIDAGIPAPVLVEMIQIFSFDVDFQREIRTDDTFELVYERFFDENGEPVHDGEIVYGNLTLSGNALPLYRYDTTEGGVDYFNGRGESVRKALMRTPIDGARLSSRFGNRRHPILGYTRLHAGVDFAAAPGTPIYAAGNGRIEQLGTNGGYGRYIRIRHNDAFQTAYAHMRGYARGLKSGSRVKQGQVIGYVGSSGRSTGPHLHYEVIREGNKIDPLSLKLPSGEKLKGQRLAAFNAYRAQVDDMRGVLTQDVQLAGIVAPVLETTEAAAAAPRGPTPIPPPRLRQ